jgi:hypothetical protein
MQEHEAVVVVVLVIVSDGIDTTSKTRFSFGYSLLSLSVFSVSPWFPVLKI